MSFAVLIRGATKQIAFEPRVSRYSFSGSLVFREVASVITKITLPFNAFTPGHLILDLRCVVIPDPDELARELDLIPGVVEHGLFIGYADVVIVGEEAGARIISRGG